MKIKKVVAREIFDSRGLPTLECEVLLEDDFVARGSVPAGMSCGKSETPELRDGGQRLLGKGVQQAIEVIERTIGPELLGTEPNVVQTDFRMLEMEDMLTGKTLGSNTMLAVGYALARAQAHVADMQLFEFIATIFDADTVSIPYPLFNLINGGMHADNNLAIQEILIIPVGSQSLRQGIESAVTLFYTLKEVLKKHGKRTVVGDEGGFCPMFKDTREALDLLVEAMQLMGQEDQFHIGLDVAASTFYDAKTKTYQMDKATYSTEKLIALYEKLVGEYPIYMIEDGIEQHDVVGWQELTARLGERIQIVGDDLFVTHPERIAVGIEQQLATAAIIKPNQVGTLTQALQAVQLCQEYGMGAIISHRSGETEDNFIADLAVGTSAGQIKAGGCSRGERLAKYNQLLRIEDQLVFGLLDD